MPIAKTVRGLEPTASRLVINEFVKQTTQHAVTGIEHQTTDGAAGPAKRIAQLQKPYPNCSLWGFHLASRSFNVMLMCRG
jgi:hypothetical protein